MLKHRAHQRVLSEANAFKTALDNQNPWVYVVNINDYRLLFINEKTREFSPYATEGSYCYSGFFNGCFLPCHFQGLKPYD